MAVTLHPHNGKIDFEQIEPKSIRKFHVKIFGVVLVMLSKIKRKINSPSKDVTRLSHILIRAYVISHKKPFLIPSSGPEKTTFK